MTIFSKSVNYWNNILIGKFLNYFMIKNTNVTINLGDVEINYKDIEGLSVASGDGTTIALDLKLDENLNIFMRGPVSEIKHTKLEI